jgi:hypothetical protein
LSGISPGGFFSGCNGRSVVAGCDASDVDGVVKAPQTPRPAAAMSPIVRIVVGIV